MEREKEDNLFANRVRGSVSKRKTVDRVSGFVTRRKTERMKA